MIESNVTAFVLLLMLAATVAVLAERLPIPYVTALANRTLRAVHQQEQSSA